MPIDIKKSDMTLVMFDENLATASGAASSAHRICDILLMHTHTMQSPQDEYNAAMHARSLLVMAVGHLTAFIEGMKKEAAEELKKEAEKGLQEPDAQESQEAAAP